MFKRYVQERFLSAFKTGMRPRWAWPTQCAVCHGWGRQRVCQACIKRFHQEKTRCQRCALPVPENVSVCGECLLKPPVFDAALAAVDYAAPWSDLIGRLKFHEGLDVSAALTDVLCAAVQAAKPAQGLLLPIPLSANRLRERGFNQSWELTQRLAKQLRWQADANLLLRIKDTPSQLLQQTRAQRLSQLRGAFAVEPLRRAELQGARVILIDDVMTSGATMTEAALALRAAGAVHIQAWVVARTLRRQEPSGAKS
jgi:ComF family protein